MLAARDFGNDATEACVEVDLRSHHVGEHLACTVDDGDGCLVAAALDGKHQGARRRNRGSRLFGARIRCDGPRAHRGTRLGTLTRLLRIDGQRKRRGHDQRIIAGTIVVAPQANLLKARALVEATRGLVAYVDLKRDFGSAQRLAVIGEASQKAAADALVTAVVPHGDVHDLKAVAREHAASKAHNRPLVMGHPPGAPRRAQVLVEELL